MQWTDLKFDVRIHDDKLQAYLAARPDKPLTGRSNLQREFFNDAQVAVEEYQRRLATTRRRNPDMTEEQAREATLLKWWNHLQGNLAEAIEGTSLKPGDEIPIFTLWVEREGKTYEVELTPLGPPFYNSREVNAIWSYNYFQARCRFNGVWYRRDKKIEERGSNLMAEGLVTEFLGEKWWEELEESPRVQQAEGPPQ